MKDCIFCKIVRGELPSKKVYEDDHVLAFEDLQPVAPVHVLIVPKTHYPDLLTMSSQAEGRRHLDKLYQALPAIAQALGLEDKGFRLINNCGEDAGQTVMHVHFHLIGGLPLDPKIL